MHFSGDLRTILKLNIDGAARRLFVVVQHDRALRAVVVPGLCGRVRSCGRLLVRPGIAPGWGYYFKAVAIHTASRVYSHAGLYTRLAGVLKIDM